MEVNFMQEEFNVLEYPEGVERAKKELLDFLPEDDEIREQFMTTILNVLIKW